ncbi:hypothetical protein [Piscinibacter terrae]|uniref:hypothetical protein n=1 Tax=Piscinibacter terrae TaxID=2496871 RepID=UPI00138676BD|nr:hypothetical protein [Albitalea terrae]
MPRRLVAFASCVTNPSALDAFLHRPRYKPAGATTGRLRHARSQPDHFTETT